MNRLVCEGFFAFALVSVVTCGSEAAEVRLAEGGRAYAKIVISANAGRSVRFGAEDLRWHLKKVTGADFSVVTDLECADGSYEIRVGESRRTRLKKRDFRFQQYCVDVGPDATELIGWDDAGTGFGVQPLITTNADGSLRVLGMPGLFDKHGSLYAVYQFLEDLVGVKWLDCTEYGTLLPRRDTLVVTTFAKRYEPFAEYRGGTFEYDLRSDCWRMEDPEHKAYERLAYINPNSHETYSKLFMLRHRIGGRYAQCNHSLCYFYDFYWNKKSKRFRGFHPEYFSKGCAEGVEPPQLCYSRQDVVDLVAADIALYFNATNADKSTPMYESRNVLGTVVKYWGDDNCAIEPMDNSEFCKCNECQRLLDIDKKKFERCNSTLWFSFVRRVAEKLLITNPGCTITTLAYMGHEYLPSGISLPKNVNVVFCPWANRAEPQAKVFADQVERMREWRAAYPDQPMGVWFYGCFPYESYNNGRYQGVHGYYCHEAAKQFKLLKELNFRQGVFYCGLEGAVEQYVSFALLLDPDADVDRLLNEYFSQFGEASGYLRRFYDLVESRYCDPLTKGKSAAGPEQCWRFVCPEAVMKELAALIDKAEKCKLSEVEKKRFLLFRNANWEYMKKGFETYLRRSSHPQPRWDCVKVPNAGGDLNKVAWEMVPELPLQMYDRGGESPAPVDWTCGYRVANDEDWFYLELDQNRISTLTTDRGRPGVVVSPEIACYDTWELVIAGQRSTPCRYFLCGADSRMSSKSFGEVNFRMNVNSAESGLANWGAKFVSDYSTGRKWCCRWAFPLANMIHHPLKPGDKFYLNPATVLHPGACGTSPFGIFSPVTYSTVKTYDRSAEVRLSK